MAAAARLFQPRSSSNPASGTNTNSTSPSSTPSNRDRDSLVFFFDVSAPLLCIPCPGILVFMCGLSLSPATQVKKSGSDRSGYAKFSNSQNVNLVRFFRSSKAARQKVVDGLWRQEKQSKVMKYDFEDNSGTQGVWRAALKKIKKSHTSGLNGGRHLFFASNLSDLQSYSAHEASLRALRTTQQFINQQTLSASYFLDPQPGTKPWVASCLGRASRCQF